MSCRTSVKGLTDLLATDITHQVLRHMPFWMLCRCQSAGWDEMAQIAQCRKGTKRLEEIYELRDQMVIYMIAPCQSDEVHYDNKYQP